MIARDPTLVGRMPIEALYRELVSNKRQVAIYLIDHHPSETHWIVHDTVLGVGWDDAPSKGQPPTLRWLGEQFSPSGFGSSTLHLDTEVGWIRLSNKLAATALNIEKGTGTQTFIFPQPQIKTLADAKKLFRFMGKYPVAA